MFAILRTIAVIDAVTVALVALVAALFGMTPGQAIGAGIVGITVTMAMLVWRAIVNATPKPRQDRINLGCDPVNRLSPDRVTAELVEPSPLEFPPRQPVIVISDDPPACIIRVEQQRQIEAPKER